MIVYFYKKSKKALSVGGVGIGFLCLVLYMGYIYKMRALHTQSTVQILRQNTQGNIEIHANDDLRSSTTKKTDNAFVASKKGVYYYPINCSKAQALSVKNMLYFKDKMGAEGAGYKPYLGCF
jgi:hypothetical protein